MARKGDVVRFVKNNCLLFAIIVGVALGVAAGLSLRSQKLSDQWILIIGYPGEIFTRALELMILPLIISSLIVGSASLNARANGKIAMRTLVYFLITSLFNALLGVLLVLWLIPETPDIKTGAKAAIVLEERKNTLLDNFLDLGRNIVPNNIFTALFRQTQTSYEKNINDDGTVTYTRYINQQYGTNTLGVIGFALIFGMVLGSMGRAAQNLIESITIVDKVIMSMVQGVMWLTPLGVASLIASKILSVNDVAEITRLLGFFVLTVVAGVLIYQLIILQLIYLFITRKNPIKFYAQMIPATITAFATASTAVALPVSFRCMANAGVDIRIAQFVLPIGATVNKDGTALFVSIASVFIAQLNGSSLGVGDLATVVIASTAVSIASASVPSAALALMFIVLNSIGVPTKDVGLLFAVDWFVDRVRTTNNHLGDCYAAAVVEHFSKEELRLMTPDSNGNIRNDNGNQIFHYPMHPI